MTASSGVCLCLLLTLLLTTPWGVHRYPSGCSELKDSQAQAGGRMKMHIR